MDDGAIATKWLNRLAQGFSRASALGMAPIEVRPEGAPNPADAGCNSNWRSTPILHHSAWPDSRTRTTTRTKRPHETSPSKDERELIPSDYSGLSIVSRFTSVAFGSRKIRGGLPEITWYAVKTNSG